MLSRRQALIGGLSTLATLSAPAYAHATSRPRSGSYRAVAYLGNQRMNFYRDGQFLDQFLISSARPGKVTPTGTFRPYFLSRHHKSSLYNNAPMPFSVFFKGNYATHGTNQISQLGSRASAGCVRLHPDNAAKLFGVAEHLGHGALQIVVSNGSA